MRISSAAFLIYTIASATIARAQAQPVLSDCTVPGVPETLKCGVVTVFENRLAGKGRTIALRVVVIPARTRPASPDPVFYLSGGPGQGATSAAAGLSARAIRDDREIVLVDARGTGASNPLHCPAVGNDDDIQSYLTSAFEASTIRKCRRTLDSIADLRFYANDLIVDDLEDVRKRLGYGRINLWGVSGGTRTALVYMRRHPTAIRSAVLSGLMPFAARNPLGHAAAAQLAFDRLASACREDAFCRQEYPDLGDKLARVLSKLKQSPARVTVMHPRTGTATEITLTEDVFADGVRGLMYSSQTARLVPALIDEANQGRLEPAAQLTMERYRALRGALAMGSLLSVVCSEDVSRIHEPDVGPATKRTYAGDFRVRSQIGACKEWPSFNAPAWASQNWKSTTPALLVSGYFDPVTPPQWGDSTAKLLPQSKHVVFAAGHVPANQCHDSLLVRFFAAGSATSLDTTCVGKIRMPPFARRDELPPRR